MTPEEQTFVEVFSDSYLASDVAGRFTCTEVEALANLLLQLNAGDAGERWVKAHMEEDCDEPELHGYYNPGDDHHAEE